MFPASIVFNLFFMRLISIFLLFSFSVAANAQTNIIQRLQSDVPGQGKVVIHQDESITALIGNRHNTVVHKQSVNASPIESKSVSPKKESSEIVSLDHSKHKNMRKEESASSMDLTLDDVESEAPKKVVKVAGYRVQVYAGNNTRNAKFEAMRVASDVRSFFPEVSVYSFFNPPRWLCRVGDFRTMEEAYLMMRKLKATRVFHEVSIVKDRVNVSL